MECKPINVYPIAHWLFEMQSLLSAGHPVCLIILIGSIYRQPMTLAGKAERLRRVMLIRCEMAR